MNERARALAAFALPPVLLFGAACGKEALDARPLTIPAQPVDVGLESPTSGASPAIGGQVLAPPLDAPAAPREEPMADSLPAAWTTGAGIPKLAFADAITRARAARDAFLRLGGPPPAPPANADASADEPRKKWFAAAHATVDRASRMYAAAFHAPDASREGRIDAIAEAAELDMSMARLLDDVGLAAMPPSWRSDPSIASTFEDVAVGPTRRWRDEARVLSKQCVETARASGVVTDAARRCATLPTGQRPRVAKNGADAGPTCACHPGDPLCSASLGGWCP